LPAGATPILPNARVDKSAISARRESSSVWPNHDRHVGFERRCMIGNERHRLRILQIGETKMSAIYNATNRPEFHWQPTTTLDPATGTFDD
jgi:hypothetical protein